MVVRLLACLFGWLVALLYTNKNICFVDCVSLLNENFVVLYTCKAIYVDLSAVLSICICLFVIFSVRPSFRPSFVSLCNFRSSLSVYLSVNLSRDLTPPSHVLSNDMCSNGVGGVLTEIRQFSHGLSIL